MSFLYTDWFKDTSNAMYICPLICKVWRLSIFVHISSRVLISCGSRVKKTCCGVNMLNSYNLTFCFLFFCGVFWDLLNVWRWSTCIRWIYYFQLKHNAVASVMRSWNRVHGLEVVNEIIFIIIYLKLLVKLLMLEIYLGKSHVASLVASLTQCFHPPTFFLFRCHIKL